MIKKQIFYPVKGVCTLLAILFSFSLTAVAVATPSVQKKFISYTDVGKGSPLLLIHAFPTDERLWEDQRADLKEHFRVISFDLWGFGKSSPVDGNAVTMTDYADEVKQLLDQLHIRKAIIGGESMGGYVALAFLQKYPDQVNGLVLSDTQSIADSEDAKIKREETAVDVLSHGTDSLISGFMAKALTNKASLQTRSFLQNILASQTSTGMASALRGMSQRMDTSPSLSSTQLPILIITGDQDEVISPEQSLAMHKLAKNSKLVTISNAAHLSSLEQPDQWNQAVVEMFYKQKT